MYHVPLAVKCIYGCSNEGSNNRDGKDGRELGLPVLLYVDNLVLCGESEEEGNGGKFCWCVGEDV